MGSDLEREFEVRFGRRARGGARAPGRVNLIGEHTDYNDGLVLPCAIDRDTRVLAAPRDDRSCRVYSRELGEEQRFDCTDLDRGDAATGWIGYVAGVLWALRESGYDLPGFDLAIASDVPLQSGLSSSAALCVGVATAIDRVASLGLDGRRRAEIAHRAESEFAGIGCGILDPFASSLCEAGAALRIDCRSREVARVGLPADLRILVAHSGVTRALAGGQYGDRLAECRQAVAEANSSLRDVSPADLPALERSLSPVSFRRARHVITENERVDATCRALESGDLRAVGHILDAGMRSLRDDFEVSVPEIDDLCAAAADVPEIYGARLTGAGFGGCTIHLVAAPHVEEAADALARGFERRRGRRPPVHVFAPGPGASALDHPGSGC